MVSINEKGDMLKGSAQPGVRCHHELDDCHELGHPWATDPVIESHFRNKCTREGNNSDTSE